MSGEAASPLGGHRACLRVFFHERLAGVPTVTVLEKGLCQRKVPPRTQQFPSQGMHGLGHGFSKCGPWTSSIRNPFRPCPDPL